jgi:hypothetical protein
MRKGHAHVGVNVSAGMTALPQDIIDPNRYGLWSIADEDGLSFDVFARFARVLRPGPEKGEIFARPVERLHLSG